MVIVLILSVFGCGGGSPTSVVRSLHTAMEKGNNKSIERLMTEEAAQLVIGLGEKAQEGIRDSGQITNTEERITGNTATVTVTYANGQTNQFDLVRERGKWKVTINK